MKLINEIFQKQGNKADNEPYESHPDQSYGINERRSNEIHQVSQTGVTKYKCPMGCEDDKTYDSPANCPVCNMKLVPVENIVHEPTEHRIVE